MKSAVWRAALLLVSTVGIRTVTDPAARGDEVGAKISYQGQLKNGGVPADGFFDFRFALQNPDLPNDLAHQCLFDVEVVRGLFTVELDLDPALFDGSPRLLAIAVKPSLSNDINDCPNTIFIGENAFVTLDPAQPISAAPYAIHALQASNGHALDAADGSPVEALVVDDNGQVGIGTTAPANPLHINANVDIGTGMTGGSLRVGSSTGSNLLVDANEIQAASNGSPTSLGLNVEGGRVGIGTVNPSEALHVVGNVQSDGEFGFETHNPNNLGAQAFFGWLNDVARIRIGGTGAGASNGLDIQTTSDRSLLRLLHNGNVGIGTTAPQSRLHINIGDAGLAPNSNAGLVVERDNNVFMNILAPDAVQSGILFGKPTGGNAVGGIVFNSGTTADGLQFRTGGNSTKMVVAADGNVGIGTTSPQARLHVVGDGQFSGDLTIGTTTRFLSLSAADFNPGANAQVGSLETNGPFLIANGSPGQQIFAHAPVHLPHGAVVTRFVAYVNDFSTVEEITVRLRRRDVLAAASSTMASVATFGTPAQFIALTDTSISNSVVDNQNFCYFVDAHWVIPSGGSIRLAGARIDYTITQPLP